MSDYRFGLKKLKDVGSFSFGLQSKFGLTPLPPEKEQVIEEVPPVETECPFVGIFGGDFNYASFCAVGNGEIYVANTQGRNIKVYDSETFELKRELTTGNFYPTGIAVTSEYIYVSCDPNGVMVYDLEGNFIVQKAQTIQLYDMASVDNDIYATRSDGLFHLEEGGGE